MSPAVRERIFSGGFPVYPYMYTLRQFMRMTDLLTAGILGQSRVFFEVMRKLHDRCGQAQGGIPAAPGGDRPQPDRPPAPDEPEHGSSDHRPTRRDAAAHALRQDRD